MNLKDMIPKIWANKAGILEGIKNRVFKNKDIEELAEHRLEICKNCIWYSENVKNKEYTELSNCITDIKSIDYIEDTKKREDIHCVNCSCNLGLKTRCLSCVCPTGRWGAVTNIAGEEQAILQIVAENESNQYIILKTSPRKQTMTI